MVSSASIIAFIVNIVICFGLFLGFMLYLLIKHKRTIIPILVGAGVFIVFQLITRIPLLGVAAQTGWYASMAQNPWLFGLFLGLTAGIFEEVGRFVGMRTLMRKNRRWIDGFAFGVGHGGIEAVTIAGLANINNLVLSIFINNGSFDQISAALNLDAQTSELLVSQLTQAPATDILLGGAERIFAFAIQIALSILVLYAVKNRKYIFIGVAVLLHMIVDAPLVILPQVFGVSIYGLEIFIAALAVLALVFIALSKRLWTNDTDMLPPDGQ